MKKGKYTKSKEPLAEKLMRHEKEEAKEYKKLAKMHKKINNKRSK